MKATINNNDLANYLFLMHNNGMNTTVTRMEDDVKVFITVIVSKDGVQRGSAFFDGFTHVQLSGGQADKLINK